MIKCMGSHCLHLHSFRACQITASLLRSQTLHSSSQAKACIAGLEGARAACLLMQPQFWHEESGLVCRELVSAGLALTAEEPQKGRHAQFSGACSTAYHLVSSPPGPSPPPCPVRLGLDPFDFFFAEQPVHCSCMHMLSIIAKGSHLH